MKGYININFHATIVYGINGACIYDFENMKMFNIDLIESRILKELEAGKRIEDICSVFPKEKIIALCDNLKKAKIASLGSTFIPREPYRSGAKNPSKQFVLFQFQKCFVELPYACDKRCPHCSAPKLFGCFACSALNQSQPVDMNFYKNVIEELIQYNCKQIYFYGGNPLSHLDEVQVLVSYIRAKSASCTIYIIIPNSDINDEQAAFLTNNSVTPIISVDWPDDNLSPKPGAIYNFNVCSEVYSGFKEYRKHLIENKITFQHSLYSIGTPIELNYLENGYIKPMKFLALDIQNMMHPCLCGLMAVKSDKKMYPCRNVDNAYCDLSKVTLDSFFAESQEYKDFWCSPIAGNCMECKYRKSCFDCKAYDIAVYKGFKGSCTIAKAIK
jgi:MoaA/NifB/PqqE/SkfB family radical SAM enzyme